VEENEDVVFQEKDMEIACSQVMKLLETLK
jgi:hypothetical protein